MYAPLPPELTISRSPIHGLGLFCTTGVKRGHEFGVSHIYDSSFEGGWIRTPLGGFYNHSDTPNCIKRLTLCGRFMILLAYQNIEPGEEITVRYTLYSVGEPAHDEASDKGD